MEKDKIKRLTKKLKPYWKEYWKIWEKFSDDINELEKRMNKELNLKPELEFFHANGECVGIGAENYRARKNFPLINGGELNK